MLLINGRQFAYAVPRVFKRLQFLLTIELVEGGSDESDFIPVPCRDGRQCRSRLLEHER